jgi:hypothetical protein
VRGGKERREGVKEMIDNQDAEMEILATSTPTQ